MRQKSRSPPSLNLPITNLKHSSFRVSLAARASNTGPIRATLSPMTIELCGPSGSFGTMTLPELETAPGGIPIEVAKQLVTITDKQALQAFIALVIKGPNAVLSLKNGSATISAATLGVGPKPIRYEREIPMPGMDGPAVSVKSASSVRTATSAKLTVVLHVKNPSPVELSFGRCYFDIRDQDDNTFATLGGNLDIRCESFEASFHGPVTWVGELEEGKTRLVGLGCVGAGWCDETIRAIDVPIMGIWKIRKALGMKYVDPFEESPEVFRWRGKFWKKGTWI